MQTCLLKYIKFRDQMTYKLEMQFWTGQSSHHLACLKTVWISGQEKLSLIVLNIQTLVWGSDGLIHWM